MDNLTTSIHADIASSQPQHVAWQLYPELLVIDADEGHTRQLAHLLTLTDYHTLITATPYQAMERYLRESFRPQAILLGQPATASHAIFKRLVERMQRRLSYSIPVMVLPQQLPTEPLVLTQRSLRSHHALSKDGAAFLDLVGKYLPLRRRSLTNQGRQVSSMVLDKLPAAGLLPRVSLELRSRNSHFRQVLKAAYNLLGDERWNALLPDVGLAQYRSVRDWPPDDDQRAIPADYLSYLNQAVAFSRKEDPASQLRLWSNIATDISLQEHSPSFMTQQALKVFSQERLLSLTLNAFVGEMNAIRGEDLHFWQQRPNGSYWVVHYSNLYAYGRAAASVTPACQVWVASLERTLKLVKLDTIWEVSEKECSCQSLTGHCLFEIRKRG